ncbi:MAG: hypothetical protein J0I81_03175 [Hyphomicrobium sp.]|nr:hypothetical protein [Hyphomicrobium sp.]
MRLLREKKATSPISPTGAVFDGVGNVERHLEEWNQSQTRALRRRWLYRNREDNFGYQKYRAVCCGRIDHFGVVCIGNHGGRAGTRRDVNSDPADQLREGLQKKAILP